VNRDQKINKLLESQADDTRRLALDELDAVARQTSTWGSKEHRESRDKAEKTYDAARRALEGYSDDQLDSALALPTQGAPTTL